jgi:hypothetical protein
VRLWKDGKPFRRVYVQTINKRFAKWAARDQVFSDYVNADKVTVSVAKPQTGFVVYGRRVA